MAHHSNAEVLDLMKSWKQKVKAAYYDFKITCKDPDLMEFISNKFISQIEKSHESVNLSQMLDTIEKIQKCVKDAKRYKFSLYNFK